MTAFILLMLLTVPVSAQRPIDTLAHTLEVIEASLEKDCEVYFDTYTSETMPLESVTLYAYDPGNNLTSERALGANGYSLTLFESGMAVESIITINTIYHNTYTTLLLKKYDALGRVIEKKEYSNYVPYTESIETYSITEDTVAKDTIIKKFYVNDTLKRTFVKTYDPSKRLYEIKTYRAGNTTPYSYYSFYLSRNKKYTRELYDNDKYQEHTETSSFCNKRRLLTKIIEKDIKLGTKKETRNYYSRNKPLVKQKEFEAGKLKLTRKNTYNEKNQLITENAIDKDETLLFQCRYEYDLNGNKILCLYFHRF